MPEPVRRGGRSIQKTVSGTGLSEDGSPVGIIFQVVDASDNAITVSGTSYAKGEVACTLTTDSQGRASTVPPSGRRTGVKKVDGLGNPLQARLLSFAWQGCLSWLVLISSRRYSRTKRGCTREETY